MVAEAQIIADFSQLRRTEGLVMQRLTHNGSGVRKCVMNFHSDVEDDTDPNSENFDYVYLRATAETDENNPNNVALTDKGVLLVGVDANCVRLAPKMADAKNSSGDVKLYVNGQIVVNDGSVTNTIISDERFKKNIKPLKNSLDVIRNSHFVEYQYNNLTSISSDKKYYGILAQEMKKVLPSTVMNVEKRMKSSDKKSTELLMFNPNDLIYSGLNAIKELDEEHQTLKNELEKEVAKNEALEKRVSELERALKVLINEEDINREVLSLKDEKSTLAKLYDNTPNPLHQSTDIEYYLPDNISIAYILIQDMNGRTIAKFNLQNSGIGKVNFDAKEYGASSGTYTYSLIVDETIVESKKMIFIQ